jgi:hypothetical protein
MSVNRARTDHSTKQHQKISVRSKLGSPIFDDVFLQPWFLPKKTAFAVLRLLPPGFRERMFSYFADYGCLRCNDRNVLYGSNGLCERCKITIQCRLVRCVKRRLTNVAEPPSPEETNKDSVRVWQARELLRDLAPKKLKSLASQRMRKSQFVNPSRGFYSPSIRR